MYEKVRVSVGGDPEGGWLVDLHDGETNAVYNPTAPTAIDAVHAALADHGKAFPKAPTENDFEPSAAQIKAWDDNRAEVKRLADEHDAAVAQAAADARAKSDAAAARAAAQTGSHQTAQAAPAEVVETEPAPTIAG